MLQAAAAAGVAWAVAHDVLDHPRPVLRADRGDDRARPRAPAAAAAAPVEMVIGVALGIAVGDLLDRGDRLRCGADRAGRAARDDGGDPARRRAARRLAGGDVGRARGRAAVDATRSRRASWTRSSAAWSASQCSPAVPRNPLTVVRRIVARPCSAELQSVLEGIAVALTDATTPPRSALLARARATSDYADRLRQELAQAEETTRLAPTYWRSRSEVERYAEAAPHVDLAVRNVRVLARATLSVIERARPCRPGSRTRCAASRRQRTGSSASSTRAGAPSRRSRRRSQPQATRRSHSKPGAPIPLGVIVGQIRSTAVDLLRALGIERSEAVEHVRAAARRAHDAGLDTKKRPPAEIRRPWLEKEREILGRVLSGVHRVVGADRPAPDPRMGISSASSREVWPPARAGYCAAHVRHGPLRRPLGAETSRARGLGGGTVTRLPGTSR